MTPAVLAVRPGFSSRFKDVEDDRRWRPYRPVPRGLVRVGELAVLGVLAALVQLPLALTLMPALMVILIGVWIHAGFMTAEFFSRVWLRAHPTMYLVSHAVITPLVTFYVSAVDWLPGRAVPAGMGWLLGRPPPAMPRIAANTADAIPSQAGANRTAEQRGELGEGGL